MTIADSTRPSATDGWPGLYDVPSGPRARIAAGVSRRLLRTIADRLGVVVAQPGEPHAPGVPTLVLRRPEEFFRRVGDDGLIGFGEAWMTQAWDSPDLHLLLDTMAREMATLVPEPLQRLRRFWAAQMPHLHRNSADQTRDNISAHYDLSNDLFAEFLDPTMSYSSGLFTCDVDAHSDHWTAGVPTSDDLEQAQIRKIDRLLDQAGVTAGSRVLEIGTGWGELAIRAAARGATVHSVTLSSEQLALANERIALAGFSEAVEVSLLDYRAVSGSYDAVVSVEMIEAVGEEFWPTYFEKIDSLLAPGGRVAIQAITMPHDRMLATRGGFTWINKYIFPGGFLPSVEAIEQVTSEHTSLRVVDRLAFGQHYAETLRQWDHAFQAASERTRELGFDEVFERMWHFYLVYSQAGFSSGYLDVQQVTLARSDEPTSGAGR
ncbi:cyclopropane-fatty-acyl-phospholipid synthase [Nocardioides daedukensis]|uniref:Cyclopropane-fatty-acyl-phospholipid synthase n=1 Tax=Nocardioides daedukensis TaxID=634462 RepID=A0A7Y9S2U4_9ACTN|nr:cyclopropane-fatty-acyl-phospholipid synthase family protein [Nocardioides daedukensis]NYG59078.1 cyclopropane-fatty-acyl-phospholipid synthase [Nocardioides daedukensis]